MQQIKSRTKAWQGEDKITYEGVAGRVEFAISGGKKVYMDGSCFDNSTRVAKAGAGIVEEVGNWGRYNKIGYALPSYPGQSAVVAEMVAFLVAIVHTPAGVAVTPVTDCAAFFFGFKDLAKEVRYTCKHAGLWRQIREASVGSDIEVLKVKAHRSESAVVGADDVEDFWGDEAADLHAKHIARESGFRELEVIKEKDRVVRIRLANAYFKKALGAF